MSVPARVRPHLMLQGGVAADAVALWTRAFANLIATPPGDSPAALWHLALGDQDFTLFDSPQPHEFAPTPSWSFMVDVDQAADVDAIIAILSEGGAVIMPPDGYPFAQRFCWVEDRFGISWQLRFGPA
ncbi:MAG: VOC family protein [Pseudomonadota bacterium]